MYGDIVQDFIEETGELLQLAEARLMYLEQVPASDQTIADLFRIVHTIKGNSRFLELGDLEAVAHSAEMVLDCFRSGRLLPERESIGALLAAMDAINDHIAALAGDTDADFDDSALIVRLGQISSGAAPSARRA